MIQNYTNGAKFPDYEFREYPKRVGDKRYMNKEEEEADILASVPVETKPAVKTVEAKPNSFAPKI